jgi:excinuclease UvrABC nuclease subunit
MTSGVYRLTFSNGADYIGKSVDIATRWKQHMDKFRAGKATRLMQAAYDAWGEPNAEVLVECHEDHIDIVESCLISRLRPRLNSTIPKDPIPGYALEDLIHYLGAPTIEHIVRISELLQSKEEYAKVLEDRDETIEHLQATAKHLRRQRTEEELTHDVMDKIKQANAAIATWKKEYTKLEAEKVSLKVYIDRLDKELEYERMSWWHKLFK